MKEKGELQILPVYCDADDLDEFILFLFHFFALFFSSVSECFVGKIQGKQTLKNEHLTVFQEVQH